MSNLNERRNNKQKVEKKSNFFESFPKKFEFFIIQFLQLLITIIISFIVGSNLLYLSEFKSGNNYLPNDPTKFPYTNNMMGGFKVKDNFDDNIKFMFPSYGNPYDLNTPPPFGDGSMGAAISDPSALSFADKILNVLTQWGWMHKKVLSDTIINQWAKSRGLLQKILLFVKEVTKKDSAGNDPIAYPIILCFLGNILVGLITFCSFFVTFIIGFVFSIISNVFNWIWTIPFIGFFPFFIIPIVCFIVSFIQSLTFPLFVYLYPLFDNYKFLIDNMSKYKYWLIVQMYIAFCYSALLGFGWPVGIGCLIPFLFVLAKKFF
jgi:hypothetical protein